MAHDDFSIFSPDSPLPLDVDGMPELRLFPERIVLISESGPRDQPRLRKAVYVPDVSSLATTNEWDKYEMWYKGVSDPAGEIRFVSSIKGDFLAASKYFQCRIIAWIEGGSDWFGFFMCARDLSLPAEERALIMDSPCRGSRRE
jgi:hypothetical protein